MGVESVRQADIRGGLDTPGSNESEGIQIDLDSPEKPERFEGFDDYPFHDQDIIRGEYRYESTPRFGQSETSEGSVQIRTGSGLIILQTQNDRPRPEKIFNALNTAINHNTDIEENFVPNQSEVWNFIQQGEIKELKILTPRGEIKSANQVDIEWEEMVGRYPIEVATLSFNLDGEEISVRYHDDTLEIRSSDERKREFVIQIFETAVSG